MRISSLYQTSLQLATLLSLSLLSLLLLCDVVHSHSCDNVDELPTSLFLQNLFSLERNDDGSYSQTDFRSNLQVIEDPDHNTANIFTDASTVNMFMLTDEPNPNTWCWGACEQYALIGQPTYNLTLYDACWTYCKNTTEFVYGLSYFHRLTHDETWHFYFGDTIYIYELDGSAQDDIKVTVLGSDPTLNEVWSHTVPANTWFAAQVNPDSVSVNPYAIGATEYAPAFQVGDYVYAEMDDGFDTFQSTYFHAYDKILELSYFPDYVPIEDDPYAIESINSLCVSYSHDYDGMTLDEVIEYYKMSLSPKGGYYTSTFYESSVEVLTSYSGNRQAISSYHYAMNDTIFFHKSSSDETYHFYTGEPVILYEIDDTSRPRILRAVPIGSDTLNGEVPHYTVRGNNWIALAFKNNNMTYWHDERNSTPFTLFGVTNAPGYATDDFEFGVPEAMVENFPEFASTIQSVYDLNQNLYDDGDDDTEEPTQPPGFTECNMTGIDLGAYYNSTSGEFDIETFNSTHGVNMTDCLNFTGDGPPQGVITYASSQEQNAFAAAAEEGEGPNPAGMTALYVIAALAATALIAFVVVRRNRNDKEVGYDDDRDYCPPDSIVVCERGGQVENLETVSVVGHGGSRRKSRSGSVSYVDFTGNVHSPKQDV